MKPKQLKLFRTSDIAFYVQEKYKRTYKKGYKAFGWAGISMIQNTMNQNGYDLETCNIDTIQDYKIILVSIISPVNWYNFVAERLQWVKGNYTVIIGGSGVDNIRPFLEFGDIFVWGRAENLIIPLIQSVLENKIFNHPSVCYSRDFSSDNRYEFCQAESLYPHTIKLTNGRSWEEKSIGCQRRCLFCQYTWTRKHIGDLQSESGSAKSLFNSNSHESTLFQLDLDTPENWPKSAYTIWGVDGVSERLRFMINKPITDEMLKKFFNGLQQAYGGKKSISIKLYNVIGLPTEKESDWITLRNIIWHSNPERIERRPDNVAIIHIYNNVFNPSPCTPTATWPVMYKEQYPTVMKMLKHENCKQYRRGIYAGTKLDFNIFGIHCLATVLKRCIAIRGIESDRNIIIKLAQKRDFDKMNSEKRLLWLEERIDTRRFTMAYKWNELPTRYLQTHTSYEKLAKISDSRLRKYGGKEGQRLADYIAGREKTK